MEYFEKYNWIKIMAIYLSAKGREILEARLKKCERELVDIREEKNIAYTLSGDTWHDNPGFNQLEQAESRKCKEISEILEKISTALPCNYDNRSTNIVQIGSIVQCFIERSHTSNQRSEENIFEIVGFGESNPNEKKITYDSPLGRALLHHEPGEVISTTIAGKPVEIEIIKLFPSWNSVKNNK
jgi:transcription elongation GreA/GreB family factor